MNSVYGYEVNRKGEVETNEAHHAIKFFGTLRYMGKEAKQKAFLMFQGYDEDNRELYEIEEVRSYVAKLFKKAPYMFYFIEQEHYENQQLLLTCLCDVTVFYQGEKLSPVEMDERGISFEDIPQYQLRIHMPNRLWNTIKAETRKYARMVNDKKGGEEIIKKMEELYGVIS